MKDFTTIRRPTECPIVHFSDTKATEELEMRTKMALMSQLETTFFAHNPAGKYLHTASNIIEGDKVDPFALFTVQQIMNMDASVLASVMQVMSSRLRIFHMLRFESGLTRDLNIFLDLRAMRVKWEPQLVEHLKTEVGTKSIHRAASVFHVFEALLVSSSQLQEVLLTLTFKDSSRNSNPPKLSSKISKTSTWNSKRSSITKCESQWRKSNTITDASGR